MKALTSAAFLIFALSLAAGCSGNKTEPQSGPANIPTVAPTPTRAPDGYQDVYFEQTPLSVSGATYTAQKLPTGLAIDPATGKISGYPEEGGLYEGIVVTAKKTGDADKTFGPFSLLIAGDPLTSQAWHLHNTGQNLFAKLPGTSGEDSKVREAIRLGYTGNGVKITVSDTGAEIAHEDLAANILASASKNYNKPAPYFGDPGVAPAKNGSTEDHGTMVTGIVNAVAWNGLGSRGVAPKAKTAVYNYLSSSQSLAIGIDQTAGDGDIFNYSYGQSGHAPFPDSGPDDNGEADYLTAIANGVKTGRGGKGRIYVKAAGNDWRYIIESPTNSNPSAALVFRSAPSVTDPDNRSPYFIVVGAVNANGFKSSYSSMGSNLWVSAAGGEFGLDQAANTFYGPFMPNSYLLMPAILTTDRSTCDYGSSAAPASGQTQYNAFEYPASPSNASCNYTSTMNGTSSATPNTVGVIALMLEANPSLTWRDVKHILAQTATQVDATRSPTSKLPWDLKGAPSTFPFPWDTASQLSPAWVTNAAGFHFHNWYGFGRIDAEAAVKAAKTYSANSLGTMALVEPAPESTVNKAIPDYNAGTGITPVTDKITFAQSKTIDAVVVRVALTHKRPGDLGIELTSPSGTKSVLLWVYNSWVDGSLTGLDYTTGVFLSNAFYGEPSAGDWTIKVLDGTAGPTPPATQTFTSWKLEIYGH